MRRARCCGFLLQTVLIASRIMKYSENKIFFNLPSLSLTIVFLFAYNSHDKEILNT